jgi:hypothetical protein
MTERSYGYLYDAKRTVVQDAASIRHHLRTMAKAGVLPAGWKYSVRTSHHTAIDITATSPKPLYAADPESLDWVRHCETGDHVHAWTDRLTAEARTVYDTCEELLAAHNHDGSDTQSDYFDVKFYGHTALRTAEGVARYVAEESAR